jgi:hypothetical protein
MRKTVLLGLLIAIAACKTPPPLPAQTPDPTQPQYAPTATIKDIMLSIVDPSADAVWLSVTTVQSSAGTVDTRRRTMRSGRRFGRARSGSCARKRAETVTYDKPQK